MSDPCDSRTTALMMRAWWLAALSALFFGGPARAEPASLAAAPRVHSITRPTTTDTEDEFPAVACDTSGHLWIAWVSYDGKGDQVLVRKLAAGDDSEAVSLSSTKHGDCWWPAMATDGAGRVWVTWSQNRGGNWDIFASFLAQGTWSDPIRLTSNADNDIGQKLTADSSGQLWMVWQAVEDQNYEVMLGRIDQEGLHQSYNVSDHPASDWEPTIVAGSNERLFVGWDSYRNGSYDVLVRQFRAGKFSPTVTIAGSPDYEAHASLAVDSENRLWVAWDHAGPHWGQHAPSRQRLHSQRRVELRCLVNGRLFTTEAGLDQALTGELARFCELPELIVDGQGRLWLFFRHLHDLTPAGMRPDGRAHQARGIWNPYVVCYANGRWSQPAMLPASNGRNDMRLAACLDQTGRVWVAWSEDGRRPERSYEPINHHVHTARLSIETDSLGTPTLVACEPVRAPSGPRKAAARKRQSYKIRAQGTEYTLVFGDTHRHTDISRCGMNYDGSLIDTYRYAIDAAALDFLAISDHDQDILKHRHSRQQQGPLQDYSWWRSQKYCDLFYIKGKFLPIYAYEHGGSLKSRGGHKNVLYSQRGMPCYEEDAPEQLFHLLRDKDAVVIPHQLADGGSATDWSQWNSQFERVAEIFQARGTYEYFGAPPGVRVSREGHFLWDALGGGVRIGVIASSDHGLVHSAYAGAYVKEFTRSGILEALRNRRTFGATDTLSIDFRIGDKLLGETVSIDGLPTFDIVVEGTAPIEQLQVVRNGKFVFATKPERADCRVRYKDMEFPPGTSAYYYVRCRQRNEEWAWSSAIWVERGLRPQ